MENVRFKPVFHIPKDGSVIDLKHCTSSKTSIILIITKLFCALKLYVQLVATGERGEGGKFISKFMLIPLFTIIKFFCSFE